MSSLARMSPLILRLGLGGVFLAFGIGKFRADEWVDTMHSMDFFTHLPWGVETSVYLVGTLEVLTGTALILGFFLRAFCLLASLQLAVILMLLYAYGIREVRDWGLLAAAVALFLNPGNIMSIDCLWGRGVQKPS